MPKNLRRISAASYLQLRSQYLQLRGVSRYRELSGNGLLVKVGGVKLLRLGAKEIGDPKGVAIRMPRTDIEQSQIPPRNQAILRKALQKALQWTLN